MPREIAFTTVDAFSSAPFGGNPAAVIIWPEATLAQDDGLAQSIAAEFNLSETAFGLMAGRTSSLFTSLGGERQRESGHATLATAHTLFTSHHPDAESIAFQSRFSGTLLARRVSETSGRSDLIALDFPVSPLITLEDGHRRRPKILETVAKAIQGFDPASVMRVAWSDVREAAIVELAAGTDLEKLSVDPTPLPELGRQLILTCPAPADSGFDIYSRVFAPASGVPEDPVTGAAHTALAPFWLLDEQSLSRLHNSKRAQSTSILHAKQVSRRGGELIVKLDEKNKRVELQGSARRVMRGVLEL